MTRRARVVGVDIGGTKIAAAVVAHPGAVERRLVRPTPRSGASAVLATVADMVAELASDDAVWPVVAVGVGAPGVIDAGEGSVLSATDILPGWAGTLVRADLERLTGLPVFVDNDVRMMARAELELGAAAGVTDAVFVSLGTGVGGALARAGRVVGGPHGTSGELGHLLVPARGPIACGCGRRDHLEAAVSGPAIAASYAARVDGPAIALPDVVERMHSGDAHARDVITSAAQLLGRALAGLLSAVDVELVVVGGGVAQIGSDFVDPFAVALREEVLAPLRSVAVRTASLGTDAPMIGAAVLSYESITAQTGVPA